MQIESKSYQNYTKGYQFFNDEYFQSLGVTNLEFMRLFRKYIKITKNLWTSDDIFKNIY